MSAVFLDTSFILALAVKSDALHAAAMRLKPVQAGPLVTTEYVLAEVLDSLSAPSR